MHRSGIAHSFETPLKFEVEKVDAGDVYTHASEGGDHSIPGDSLLARENGEALAEAEEV